MRGHTKPVLSALFVSERLAVSAGARHARASHGLQILTGHALA